MCIRDSPAIQAFRPKTTEGLSLQNAAGTVTLTLTEEGIKAHVAGERMILMGEGELLQLITKRFLNFFNAHVHIAPNGEETSAPTVFATKLAHATNKFKTL